MKTIAYLIYGDRPEYHLELTYSVMSALHFLRRNPSDIRIVLVSDDKNRRIDLPIEHIVVEDGDFRRWTLNGRYNHAAKVHALLTVMDRYKGSVALIDTDTWFRKHPDTLFARIDERHSLMQAEDGVLGEHPIWRPLLDAVRGTASGYPVTDESRMGNSGVVGVDYALRPVIEDVLALMTTLHEVRPVFSIEQFAFTAVLERHTEVGVCPDIIWHYWGHERYFCHAQLERLSPRFCGEDFFAHVDDLPSIGYPKKTLLNKLRSRLKQFQRRYGLEYRSAYLAYLSAMSSKDIVHANVWARLALEIIEGSRPQARFISRDFKLMRPDRLDGHAWLKPDIKQRWKDYWAKALVA